MEILIRALGATIQEETGVECIYPWEDQKPTGTLLLYPMKPQIYNTDPNDQVHEDSYIKTIENIGLTYSLTGNSRQDHNKAMKDLHLLTKFFSRSLTLDTAKTFFHPKRDGEDREFTDISTGSGLTVPCIFSEVESTGDIYTAEQLGSNGFQISVDYQCQIPININSGEWDTSDEVKDPLLDLFKGYPELKDDLWCYLPCDEKDGNTLYDISGNKKNAKFDEDNNISSLTDSDFYGNYIDFALVTGNNFAVVSDFQSESNPFFNYRGTFTISALIYLDDPTTTGYICSTRAPYDSYRGVALYLNSYDLQFFIDEGSDSDLVKTYDLVTEISQPIIKNQWVHVVATYYYLAGCYGHYTLMSIYIDGNLFFYSREITENSFEGLTNLTIGNINSQNSNVNFHLKKKIKHLGFWKRPLHAGNIRDLNLIYKNKGLIPMSMTRSS